jgi:dihydrofolate reductase
MRYESWRKRLEELKRPKPVTPIPNVAAILAMTEYGGIGIKNTLPWGRIKGDLARFKAFTLGNVVIQGYNTYMSIGKPLPARINIVITSRDKPGPDAEWPDEVHRVDSVQAALDLAKTFNTEWVYVIGGAQIYEAMLPYCSRIELTVVASEDTCDTFVKFENGVKEWRFDLLESVKHDNGILSHVYYQLYR